MGADLVGAAGLERDPAATWCVEGARAPRSGSRRCAGRSLLVDTSVRRARSRPMGASMVPLSASGPPLTSARYSRRTWRSFICRCSASNASSSLATTSSPEVSRSRRWTMPARCGSPPPAARPRSASASVGPVWPGAGWVTRPAGLSTTIRWSSSKAISNAGAASAAAAGLSSGCSTLTLSPSCMRWFLGRVRPSTSTAPAAISRCAAAREGAASRAVRKASRRRPASRSSLVRSSEPVAAPSRRRTAARTPPPRCTSRPG